MSSARVSRAIMHGTARAECYFNQPCEQGAKRQACDLLQDKQTRDSQWTGKKHAPIHYRYVSSYCRSRRSQTHTCFFLNSRCWSSSAFCSVSFLISMLSFSKFLPDSHGPDVLKGAQILDAFSNVHNTHIKQRKYSLQYFLRIASKSC